ncbi:hypothetical protein [Mycobacterium sp. 852002-40037_SCH5390672]|uniref:hypothetical protein n=1 Tax=Mycobacterium sp. 852002-40037_SCH5390672 TaxID=1834089 RepID=UPI0008055A76|nr:hypothetical protein [Mycobacterium sp. 852002-40037_SCH5390672]OBB92573.1 hypothetical protein A5782_14000 [Mycobacterium sp. 852002-40037_SCH5390672]
MTGSGVKGRWGRVLRYAFGAALCLLAGINVLIGSAWYLSLGVAACGVGIIYGSGRRIFGAGVSRTGDTIVCRYIPWYEGNTYIFGIFLPLMGVVAFAAGSAPGHPPAWLRYCGIILFAIFALLVVVAVWIWRRSLLRITPSSLTVRIAERGSELTDIRREYVRSIEPKLVPNAAAGTERLQVEIAYQPADVSSETTATVMLGLYLSVQPINLVNALVAWKDGAHDNPSELLDRIERILRGRSTAGV